jgi:leucine dehydrogenase
MTTLTDMHKTFKDLQEFDNHQLISYIQDEKTGLEGFIVIHRNNSGIPSFGATRFWNYTSDLDALKDALRLSKMMSYKAALAGLNCGGAKAVLIHKENIAQTPVERRELFRKYSERVNFLKGHFVTGTDVGVNQEDLTAMKEGGEYVVGFNDNATKFTAIGVFESIKVCLNEVFDTSELTGRRFAIQGLGKVGAELLKYIYPAVGDSGKIYVTDINPDVVNDIVKKYPNVISVNSEDIHKQSVDVFAPCALSHSLNAKTISSMKARIIVGSANNQLVNEEIGVLLYKLGILYAPDYVVNSGGLIAVFDEYINKKYDETRVKDAVMKIPESLKEIIVKSYKQHKATNIVANEMAEKIFNSYA